MTVTKTGAYMVGLTGVRVTLLLHVEASTASTRRTCNLRELFDDEMYPIVAEGAEMRCF